MALFQACLAPVFDLESAVAAWLEAAAYPYFCTPQSSRNGGPSGRMMHGACALSAFLALRGAFQQVGQLRLPKAGLRRGAVASGLLAGGDEKVTRVFQAFDLFVHHTRLWRVAFVVG